MDPNAALKAFLDALAEGDRTAALEALDALRGWIEIGGFLPRDPRNQL